jgi:hypothetical protein
MDITEILINIQSDAGKILFLHEPLLLFSDISYYLDNKKPYDIKGSVSFRSLAPAIMWLMLN